MNEKNNNIEPRERKILCVIGGSGTGKTEETKLVSERYISNDNIPELQRKVIVFDIQLEYIDLPEISLEDVESFSLQENAEIVRLVNPLVDKKSASKEELRGMFIHLMRNFRGGLLVIEEPLAYFEEEYITDFVGLCAAYKSCDLDLIMHFKTINDIPLELMKITDVIRMHYDPQSVQQANNVSEHKELLKIAQQLVIYKYRQQDNKYYNCYIDLVESCIKGAYTEGEYNLAVKNYMEGNTELINRTAESLNTDEDGAKDYLVKTFYAPFSQYF